MFDRKNVIIKLHRIRDRRRSRGLQRKIRKLFLIMMGICVLFCFGIFYIILQTKMEENVIEKEQSNRNTVTENYERSIENLNSISHLLMLRNGITSYLRQEQVAAGSNKEAVQDVYDVLYTFDIPCYVTIFRKDRRYANTGVGVMGIDVDGVFYSKWLEEVDDKKGGYVIKSNREQYFSVPTDQLITFVRQVNDTNTQRQLGYLAISVSHNLFGQTYEPIADKKNHFAIFDGSGYMLDSDKPELFSTKNAMAQHDSRIHRGIFREDIIRYEKIAGTDFVLAIWSEVELWRGLSVKMAIGMIIGVLLVIFCMFYVNSYIVHHVTKPIHTLVDSMSEVQNGWLHRVSMEIGDDEIGHLKNSYNAMLIEINQLIEELIQQEKNLQKAEMDALQEQIKPHFLYNTLDTIRFMALENQPEKVYDMLETLGNFYRRFLSKGSIDIPLAQEIEIVQSYLKLQKNRYEDVFEDEYEIEEGLENIRVPRLILQPLVENSIYHGVRLKGQKGVIRVSICHEEDELVIRVYDTGVGMSKEQMQKLLEKKDTSSFGIMGTIRRIQYYYKKEDVFEINSIEGEYCEVCLHLPLEGGLACIK